MPGGKRPGAGRPRGSLSKKTLEVQERLARMGCDPIIGMAIIAADEMSAGKDGDRVLAGRMYAELAQYVAPKRRAVEHSGGLEVTDTNAVAAALAILRGDE